ncbi:MAG: hypothetical protein KME60_11705 [Cyanomargarita calcarea GSE-NOS-MK-12-04C]|jgi:hypothetical protein|uniref:PEP-CTERM protein-sorting domain-containing protein n=1 Tax=Cyanomargarita calcarea GSE-NOS-MK-12-04C TaxID=2839659 RepID=A0A951QLR2_9CYAN|nr:hypothetical protein [Cyanomargarita calcarea GSE-NOS-MK-12-04C]
MPRLYTSSLLGILTLVGFGLSIESAKAQTTYTFNATYDASSMLSNSITQDITARTISGSSSNASFGLTKASGLLYVQTDLSSGSYRYSTNPVTFGLQNLPLGGVTLFGEGNNKLFYAVDNGTGVLNSETLTTTGSNTNNITGGKGLFQGATGMLTGSEVYQVANLLVDPTSPSKGRVTINGTISVLTTQKVPEPNTTAALAGIGLIGVTFLLCSIRHQIRT